MAIDLTGIHNVGEFYSHHYLDSLLENDLKGLFAEWKEENDDTPDKRVNRLASEFFVAKRKAMQANQEKIRVDAPHRIHVKLLEALGYEYKFDTRYMLEDQMVPVLSVVQRDGQEYLWIVETQFPEEDQSPFGHRLSEYQFPKQEGDIRIPEETWEELIREIFRKDEPPRWVLLFAGRYIYLIDRTKWGYGQYLMFDLDEIFGRRQGDTIRALAALLAKEGLAPDGGVPLHFSLDENSHKHAFGVSKDLKYGLRRSVELLANEYVWYQRNIGKQALFQDDEVAKKLTNEALSYLYRLLFLFYAEARAGELNIVPMKSDAYQKGYSLEMLRDLEQTPLNTPQAQNGFFINDSLEKLFNLLNDGYQPSQMALITDQAGEQVFQEYGFKIQGLNSPLFDPAKTPMLSKAKLRNIVLQEVIQLLSLSRETKRSKYGRGRISYAQLGINQLGAVYEGLLSYTGFFAQETLYEVKPAKVKKSDEMGQTYFISGSELDRYELDEFIYAEVPDGTKQRKSYPKGTFIFRLAGRDREKSASYYTPEVLTQCVVKYSLKELLKDKTADEILKLTICEPAMGSGAFINEAVNQLADAYLERKQKELGERIPADDYRHEHQKVKYYLATNNAYGVDLNPTAVELAKVSLWLNIIYDGAKVPWFGPRLAVGNSLIGARRQVYTAEDVLSGKYKKKAPEPVPLGDGEGNFAPRPSGTVYHWLLPDEGMAAFDKDKVIKELAPTEVQAIKDWRKDFTRKIPKTELNTMQALSNAADNLWEIHWREREVILARTKQDIPVWGQELFSKLQASTNVLSITQKERELSHLNRPTSPCRRLKLAMDYWCALWFWPIPEAEQLPTRVQFLNEISELFKQATEEFKRLPEQLGLFQTQQKPKQRAFTDIPVPNVEDLSSQYGRLELANEMARKIRFQHWSVVFPELFLKNSGVDLIVGNPPWIQLQWKQLSVLSDMDPYIAIKEYDTTQTEGERPRLLSGQKNLFTYLSDFIEMAGQKSFFDQKTFRKHIGNIKINLYAIFIALGWSIGSDRGVVGFLHDQGLYSSAYGGDFRNHIYNHLNYYFHFHNELKLFNEVDHTKKFEISVMCAKCKPNGVNFISVVNLFHPKTLDMSFTHDGFGNVPGIKDELNRWELRGHKSRVVQIKESDLGAICQLYEAPGTHPRDSRFPQIHSMQILSVIQKFTKHEERFKTLRKNIFHDVILHETNSLRAKKIIPRVARPVRRRNWIVSAPHIWVATPVYQEAKIDYRNRQDYEQIDLVSISDSFLPRAIFQATDDLITKIEEREPKEIAKFRLLNRTMVLTTYERSLISAVLPPYTAHLDFCWSTTYKNNYDLCVAAAFTASLPLDFIVKTIGKLHIRTNILDILPIKLNAPSQMITRILRLNCITNYYSELWRDLFKPGFCHDAWAKIDPRLRSWSTLTSKWQRDVALRTPFERRQALVEIDVLAAMALELTLDELLTIYRVQFPVLQKNERRLLCDQRGMEVPVKTVRGELMVNEDHEDFLEMVPPFTPVNREADYRQAWAFFEKKLKEE
jgi:hypothetical protein